MPGDPQHALPVRRAAEVDRQRPDARADLAARPIAYDGKADGDPTWDTLPLEVRQQCEKARLTQTPGVASFVAQPEVRRSKDGSSRRSILAWRLDADDQLLVIEAAFPLESPRAKWRVRVPPLADLTVQHASMTPVPRPAPDQPGHGAAAPPHLEDYRGAVPEVWANLPRRVRDALDVAVPLDVARVEEGAARLWYRHTEAGTSVVEKIWYGRHGRNHGLSAVFAERSAPSALAGVDPDSLRRAVLESPWDVLAFRVRVDWANARRLGGKRRELGRGGPKELKAGLRRSELPPAPAADERDALSSGDDAPSTEAAESPRAFRNPFRRS